jgi:hypothetical protein
MLLAASLAAICALAMTAGTAAAWTPENLGMRTAGTMTLKLNGANAKTCSFDNYPAGVLSAKVEYDARDATGGWYMYLNCGGGNNFGWDLSGYAKNVSGTFYLNDVEDSADIPTTPWAISSYRGKPWNAQWVNASGTTPSHVTLNETYIGYAAGVGGGKITATGTINFTEFWGKSLTLP